MEFIAAVAWGINLHSRISQVLWGGVNVCNFELGWGSIWRRSLRRLSECRAENKSD